MSGGDVADGVWIVQRGRVELSVGAGCRGAVVHVLQPGDIDDDVPLPQRTLAAMLGVQRPS